MTVFARAGERVYGTRPNRRNGKPEDFHVATIRHDLFIGELPDFPACLGDWQQVDPPVARHCVIETSNTFTTRIESYTETDGTQTATLFSTKTDTATSTRTNVVDVAAHGGGEAPIFGVPWNGESWWRPYEHEVGGDRASLHYDLRFRSPKGTCTWRMDELMGTASGD